MMAAAALVRAAVTMSALWLATAGVALLFAPQEAGELLIEDAGRGAPLLQLLGAALLGFAAMNWIARGSILGGIYGRSVVAANETHLTIGALVLLKHGVVAGGSTAFWILTAVYVLAAALFLRLTFGAGTRAN